MTKGYPIEDLYKMAIDITLEESKVSVSLLQRKLQIGYALACHLLDLMEERKIIGEANGSRPREIFKKPH